MEDDVKLTVTNYYNHVVWQDHQQCYREAGYTQPITVGKAKGENFVQIIGSGTLTEQRQGGQSWSICHFCILTLSLTSAVY